MARLDVWIVAVLTVALAWSRADGGDANGQEHMAGGEQGPVADAEGIYCRLRGAEYAERTVELRRVLESAAETVEVEAGLRLLFADASEVAHDLIDLIVAERKCCPFLRFTLELVEDDGPLVVTVTGPPEARSVILGAFGSGAADEPRR